jgi:hypothetical protein
MGSAAISTPATPPKTLPLGFANEIFNWPCMRRASPLPVPDDVHDPVKRKILKRPFRMKEQTKTFKFLISYKRIGTKW